VDGPSTAATVLCPETRTSPSTIAETSRALLFRGQIWARPERTRAVEAVFGSGLDSGVVKEKVANTGISHSDCGSKLLCNTMQLTRSSSYTVREPRNGHTSAGPSRSWTLREVMAMPDAEWVRIIHHHHHHHPQELSRFCGETRMGLTRSDY
jgi:hypothetical protein